MNTTWTIQSHSVLTLDYRAMNVCWTDSCVHSHVVSLCLHSQSPDTTGLASHTAYMERTSTHNLTRTQIWCVLECDAVYSCRDRQDFKGTCPLYNQDSLLHWGWRQQIPPKFWHLLPDHISRNTDLLLGFNLWWSRCLSCVQHTHTM